MAPDTSPGQFGGPTGGWVPEPPSVVPTVLITLFFGLFGLIPASLASDEARRNRQDGSRYWKAFWIVFLSMLVVEVVIAILFFLGALQLFKSSESQIANEPTYAAASSQTNYSQPTTNYPTAATSAPTPSVDPRVQAEQQLEAARASSLQGIDLDGRWVLQLDSKYDGITDPRQTTASGSHTFGLVDIWAGHQDLVTKMRSSGINKVLLLQATDFGLQTSLPGTTWVTLADPGNIADADAGNAECAQLFPNLSGDDLANSCVPRQLSAPHS